MAQLTNAEQKRRDECNAIYRFLNERGNEPTSAVEIAEAFDKDYAWVERRIGHMRDSINSGADISAYPLSSRKGFMLVKYASDEDIAKCFVSLFGKSKKLAERVNALAGILSQNEECQDAVRTYYSWLAELHDRGDEYNEYWYD